MVKKDKLCESIIRNSPEAYLEIKRRLFDQGQLIAEDVIADEIEPLDTEEEIDYDSYDEEFAIDEDERSIFLELMSNGRMLGGENGFYREGVMYLEFRKKAGVEDFLDYLDDSQYVDTYEVELSLLDRWTGTSEDVEVDFDDIHDDYLYEFRVFVYLLPEFVQYAPEYDDVDSAFLEDPVGAMSRNGVIEEVRRRIKVNFKGKRRIKMQCNKGFRWNAEKKTCIKISGAELARKRKAIRRMVLTKRSKGAGFRARVNRKTKRSRRFRKSMGMRT